MPRSPLVTYLHVREDALQLFGFAQAAERELFELLLGVSGVGPKASLAIVSGYEPDQIRRAVATSDHALFTSISGIGKKTAERVVLDLKDKVGTVPVAVAEGAPAHAVNGHTAARDALVGLGMTVSEAESALREVDPELPLEERVRAGAGRRRGVSTRVPDPLLAPGEEELDQTLRPRRLSEFVGQDAVKEQLSIFMAAAKARVGALRARAAGRAARPRARRRWPGSSPPRWDLRCASCRGRRSTARRTWRRS